MRTAKLILAFASFGIFTALIAYNSKPSKVDNRMFILIYKPAKERPESDKLSALEKAIIQVESSVNDRAVNNRTNAVGCMQIRPIMVREVNRILSIKGNMKKRFTYDDRLNRDKSLDMFRIWRAFHHKNDSREIVARCWNGGGDGHKMTATIKYWNKVKRLI